MERLPDPDFTPVPPIETADRLRMLLVIARPDNTPEIGYHAEARAVVDYAREHQLPIEIDVLRPPTFYNLQEALKQKRYHIVHFDGHGGYGDLSNVSKFPTRQDANIQGAEECA